MVIKAKNVNPFAEPKARGDDKLEGKCEQLYPNGKKCIECTYINGKLHGKYEQWHVEGNIEVKCYYEDDKKEGKYQKWHCNGNKEIECNSFCRAKGERR